MLIEAARRAEAAAREMLALVNAGEASCAEMREMLVVLNPTMVIMSAAQTAAAANIAGSECHGDGGAEVLAGAAGITRQEARSQVKTAETLRQAPKLRDAVESGRVPAANARRLAEAVEKTSAADVESDGDLLAKAESLRPEQFTTEARRWTVDRQGDGGASEHARQRARRGVRMWDGDDGMVHLRGEFDAVTGRRIRSRLRADAARMLDADKKAAKNGGAGRRNFDQCMADALDNLTAGAVGRGKPFADICVVAHLDDVTGKLVAETPEGHRLPPAVLEELACNAKFTGVLYDRKGKPIWRTEPTRRVTDAQWQLLIARYGGCFHCGANPGICQAHHIEPVSRGGPTKLDNLVPACWTCHHRIHHDGWQIHKSPDGNHTLHPPDHIHNGPARAPEPPLLFRPADEQGADLPTGPYTEDAAAIGSLPMPGVGPAARRAPTPVPKNEPRGSCDSSRSSTLGVRPGPEAARAALRSAGNPRNRPGRGSTKGTSLALIQPRPVPAQEQSDESLFDP